MRGDGEPLGWNIIEGIVTSASALAGDGVGRVIDVTIDLRKAQKPDQKEAFSQTWIQ